MNYTEHETGLLEESQGAFAPEDLPAGSIVYSRQFTAKRADGTFRRVVIYTAATYLSDEDEDTEVPGGYEVEEIIETLDYTDEADAGSSETFSDYRYEFPYDIAFDTMAEANDRAKAAISDWSAAGLTEMTSAED